MASGRKKLIWDLKFLLLPGKTECFFNCFQTLPGPLLKIKKGLLVIPKIYTGIPGH